MPHQQLDQFDSQDSNPAVREARAVRETEAFMNDFPDYFDCPENTRVMLAWINNAGVPISRRNLSIAHGVLKSFGNVIIERPKAVVPVREVTQGDRGITKTAVKDTVVLKYKAEDTPLNQQLVDRDYLARQQLCRIGDDPKKTALGALHRKSLLDERESRDDVTYVAARQKVALKYPNIKRDSPQFNRLVVEVIEAS